MELSRHAAERKQQRGFQADDIDLIIRFGTPIRRQGNVVEYQMRKKNEKHMVQAIDRIRTKAVLVSSDETTVVTVYNMDKKR
jgi:hypothetical protein